MKWSLINHLTEGLRRKPIGEQKQPTQWPSEASAIIRNEWGEDVVVGNCRRKAFFRLLFDSYVFYGNKYSFWETLLKVVSSNKLPTNRYLQWIGRSGEMYEEMQIRLSKESGVFIQEQVPIYIPQYNVSGKIDLVTINPTNGKYNTNEFKSVYGYNAKAVLGTPASRRKGILGSPKESHLMQTGIYEYHFAAPDERFEDTFLIYGARDTGEYAEYIITIEEGTNKIQYKGNCPVETETVTTEITIDSIFSNYEYVQKCIDSGVIPDRDYDLQYSEEKIQTMYERKLLTEKERETHEKRTLQISQGKKPIKGIEKGDWQCSYCQFQKVCYQEDDSPRSL